MNTWKKNLEETKQHYRDWWQHKGIVLNMWEHFQTGVTPHTDVAPPPPARDLDQQWFDPEWRAQYLDWYVAHSSLLADMLPVANTQLGPGSLAAILGAVYEGGEDTIWIHPDPHYTDDFVFHSDHPNYLLHKQLLSACKQKAQGHYYVGMPDLMEGLDVLAAMKGTDKVLLDTVMQPEVLEQQVQRINDIYFQVFDELYDIIREGDEMAFCYFSAWAPGKMSKLQCDISTMISTDDYRRFVQPFIREQCRRIDYTLYHLDGVGAMHHLPALLEIGELNAIQWTPGVGQPQGGSDKWYGLYRDILKAGKSIMACWVTLDELPPLLDHIGTDGVHLEMDFHNEQEVEQALEIVERYRTKPAAVPPTRHLAPGTPAPETPVAVPPLRERARQRILMLDGGMGTMIQQYRLHEEDFRGVRFADHPHTLAGCNDVLPMTCPFVVRDIHRRYLEAGADLIETDTFNAQRVSLAGFGLQDYCRDINLAACATAREVADEFTRRTPDKPRYVLGSVGPTGKTCSFAAGDGEPLTEEALLEAYREQMEALLDGGVDAILIETIFDTLNARIAMQAAVGAMESRQRTVPLMLSFNVATPEGRNMLGQDVVDFVLHLPDSLSRHLFSVGINCLADVAAMTPLLHRMGDSLPYAVSCYPNAGKPDGMGGYSRSPEELQRDVWPLVEGHRLNILGGCCGTTDAYIRQMARLVQPIDGLLVSPLPLDRHTTAAESPGFAAESPGFASESNGFTEKNNSFTAESPSSTPASPADSVVSPHAVAPESPSAGDELFRAIVAGNGAAAAEATQKAVDQGAVPQDLINGQMVRAMGEVGQRFEDGKAFVPQLLMAGRAMKAGLELLKPLMAEGESAAVGKVLIGTVKGDLHDIGKNLVASMLEGSGFEVVNIGIDVSAETFVEAVRQHRPDILCMSALLTTTMGYMRQVIEALDAAGLRPPLKVMVGGAPVTQAYADEIGADGYSDNANSAVEVAKRLMGL